MPSSSPAPPADLREQLVHECASMARYALSSGMAIPPALMCEIEKMRTSDRSPAAMASLTRAHAQLVKLVSPATPRALLLLGDENHSAASKIAWLGHVGVVRRMMLVAAVSVICFLAVSISDKITNPSESLLHASGWNAFAIEVWWVSAAAMGASFAMLMQVGDYIVKRTYDAKYEPTYWIKFMLGIMGGLILASMISFDQATGPVAEFGRPTLAMLGGFSASAVYRILTRLVETVESIFRPSAKDEAAERERAAVARAAEESGHSRVALATRIVQIQQQLASGAAPTEVSAGLQQILRTLVAETAAPGETAEEPAATIALPGIPVVAVPEAPAGEGDAAEDDAPAAMASAAAG